jgi:hypothetical protein
MVEFNLSYKKELKDLYRMCSKDESGFAMATKRLQETYPGNYTIVECYIPEKYCWGPKLVFEDPQEEIAFILTYL